MPLQGLSEESKVTLLEQLVSKAISVGELRDRADSIKAKQRVITQWKIFSGASSWDELKQRFPKLATEEKVAQFTKLPGIRGKEVPMVRPAIPYENISHPEYNWYISHV